MIWVDLIYNLALLVALSVVSGFVDARWKPSTRLGAVLQGVVFGGAAVIGMLRPFVFAPGLIFDGRSVMISLGSLFFGPWAAAVTCLMTLPLRLAQGGPGVWMGVSVILASAGIGVGFHMRRQQASREVSAATLLGFGLVVHLAMLAMTVLLPAEMILPVLGRIAWPVILTYPLATVLIGKILSDQAARAGLVESLKQSERFLNALLQAIPIPVFYKNREGRYLGTNDAFRGFFGAAHTDLVGKTVFDVHPPELAALYQAQDAALLKQGGTQRYEAQIQNALGVQRDVLFEKAVFRDAQGQVAGLIGTIIDLTERRKAEIEREQLNAELAAKNRELQNVLYAASHDLRSPLLNIEGFSRRVDKACAELKELLEDATLLDATRRSVAPLVGEQIPTALRFIHTSVEKMDTLIGGMLRLSRLGQVTVCRERLDMNDLLNQVVATMTIQVQSAGAQVVLGPLPACTGDPLLLNQTFSNLIDNALKYRDPARATRIEVTGRVEGASSVYCVADNGLGIPPEHLEGIWELFRRLNPTGPPGEGLGLTLVRRIVERHGGRVWVESVPGEGSRFFVSIPT